MHPLSPRLQFALATTNDEPWLQSLFMDAEIMVHIPRGAMNKARALQTAQKAIGFSDQPGLGYWVFRLKGKAQPIGYVVLRDFSWDERFQGIELGYLIDKKYWGQGFASEASEAIAEFAFQTLKVTKLLALVNDKNSGSIRIVEKLGFKKNPRLLEKHPGSFVWECHKH